MARVLVTDGDQRAALAIVRSLGPAGHHCMVVSTSGRSVAGASRYAAHESRLPHPGREPDAFVSAVMREVDLHRIDIVLPVAEESILALLPHREHIAAIIPFPSLESFRSICDKRQVLEAASATGIRVPRQTVLQSPADARNMEMPFPLVLKPSRSVFTAGDGTRGKVSVRWVHAPEELQSELDAYPPEAYPVLAQEAITGPGVGVFLLVKERAAIACFSHRRLREKPPTGGVSVLCRSEPLDAGLLERSLALLNRFDWSGVAMVEFKRDQRTGEAVLMEINGRFWGSLQLAVDAGVNFPRMLVEMALGSTPPRVDQYKEVTSRWWWGDVDNLIARLRSRHATMSTRLLAVREWVAAFAPGIRNEVFRIRDPLPAARETVQWFRSALGK